MTGLDLWLVEAVVGLRNPALTYLIQNLTLFGSLVFAVVLGISIYRFDAELSTAIFSSSALSFLMAHALKLALSRPRPPVEALVSVSSYSFPSGHAAVSFGLATVLSERSGYRMFYILAILVCFSRVYLGIHYFSDVLAGAVLGYFAGIVTQNFLPRVLVQLRDTFRPR